MGAKIEQDVIDEVRAFYETHKWWGYSGIGRRFGLHPFTVSKIIRRLKEYADA